MKSRRQFVIEGTLAATAVLVSHHLASIANFSSTFFNTSFANLSFHNNHLVLLHTANNGQLYNTGIMREIKKVQERIPNSIFVNKKSEKYSPDQITNSEKNIEQSSNENFSIVTKGKVKTGVIYVKPNSEDVITKTESLAAFLKQKEKCAIVVCVSHLGHKQKNSIDDLSLASQSNNIDVIFNGHENNFLPQTLVVANSQKNEVIIQSSKNKLSTFGKLEICFDDDGRKKHIHLATKFFKDIQTA